MAKVQDLVIHASPDGFIINATISTFYGMDSPVIYILQIIDETSGYVVYLNWKPFMAKQSNLSVSLLDYAVVEVKHLNYSIKIMVWTDIDGALYPLILKPITRTSAVV